MRLVCMVRPGCFDPNVRFELYFVYDGEDAQKHLRDCHSYKPGFRFVTVEAAREDYGIKVPARGGE